MLDKQPQRDLVETTERKRYFDPSPSEDLDLGPLTHLPGLWKNVTEDGSLTDGRGWNLIALPFFEEGQFRDFRLLMNRYNEELRFTFVDDMVPNRGVEKNPSAEFDQFVVTLDYQQAIKQTDADDFSQTPLAGGSDLAIHHEPGLFLHMLNRRTDGIDVARLATVPHGNSALAIGSSSTYNGPPQNVDGASGFPEGAIAADEEINAAVDAATADNAYLRPYNKFTVEPFLGIFSAKTPFDTLKGALSAFNVVRTTELRMDTSRDKAGIHNIPFVERRADANFMRSTFYILELEETGADGKPKMALAYTQFIFLDFFRRRDGKEGLIRWPHISMNVMEKVDVPKEDDPYMTKKSCYDFGG
ncbi:heme-binding protein [Pseudoruegeria sp. HB172150]|uniref:heme-binding protein n=1 Tax=Pseudoruegeria sp. HB172150 TaxID=2721164 RepID=UPI00155323D3|nr:heme-binding protein [Pseudoruegeria sp. HB172150]